MNAIEMCQVCEHVPLDEYGCANHKQEKECIECCGCSAGDEQACDICGEVHGEGWDI